MRKASILTLFFWLVSGSGLLAQSGTQIEVSSDINPSTIRMGATARYTINIVQTNSGNFGLNSTPNGSVPNVPGLNITYLGQSTSTRTAYSNITGTTRTVTLALNYQVRPEAPGAYQIPAFRILFEGREYRVPSAALTVQEADAGTEDPDMPPLLELDLLLPDEKVFVGQALKTNLQLYVLDRIPNIRMDYPVKIGDAWAQGAMSDNQTRSRATYQGYEYDVYSRPLLLTPLKAGKQDLLYEMNVQALLPTSGSIFDESNSTPNSPFNDPFFQQFNFRLNPQLQYQNRIVETDRLEIEVHPLPEENQPAAFSGAIGEFTLKAFPGSNTVKAGDPLTLRLQVAGQGNFDRILPPVLDLGDQWRTYDPETSFRQGDVLGFSGVKHFDYTLIPLDSGISSIPEISIAYFNPQTEEYDVLTTGRIPLTVEENPNLDLNQVPQVAGGAGTDDSQPALFALETQPGPWVGFSSPLLYSKNFVAFQGLPLLALLTLVLVRRHQLKVQQDLEKQRIRKLDTRIQNLHGQIAQAVRDQEPATALSLMLQGSRLVLSKRFGPKAEAATWQDVESLLAQIDSPPDLTQSLESLFQQGEAVAYAGHQALQHDLSDLRHQWESTLKQLEQEIAGSQKTEIRRQKKGS